MATSTERFLFLSFLGGIIIIWRRVACVIVERAVKPLDIFVLRIWATLPVPEEWRENHYIAGNRRRIRGQC